MKHSIYLISTLCLLLSCSNSEKLEQKKIEVLNTNSQEIISLSGEWELALYSEESILKEQTIHHLTFNDVVNLPGSLAENKKGIINNDREVWKNLSVEYHFEGTAYYKRTINIPKEWKGKYVTLRMERTRKTAVWLDGMLLGTNPYLSTAQVYYIKDVEPGAHELIVAVDNIVSAHPAGRSHMNEEATQTNWNGVLGKFQLEATPQVFVSKVRVFPKVKSKQAELEFTIDNHLVGIQKGHIKIETSSFNSENKHLAKSVSIDFQIEGTSKKIKAVVELGEDMLLWDEFNPALYRAKIILELENGETQQLGRSFGMRTFTQNGSQFVINGNTTFLRGKHDACVFPLTGYAPMDVKEWVRVLNIAKEYGINHYRFHTWCPPEAALAAADLVGIYMQPELPSWGELDAQERGVSFKDINAVAFGSEKTNKGKKYDSSIQTEAEKFFHKAAEHILDNYGNYASFVMFGIGNELKGNVTVMERLVDGFRTYDNNRRLYSQGSNNNFRDPKKGIRDDYFTTVRTSTKIWENYDNNTRISYSRADQFDGGIVNHLKPSTRYNFTKALETTNVPVIGHETGQYSYYPDYNEIEKYTGITKPWNLEIGQKLLKEKGMYNQWPEFFKAAGRWASILYCEDMESGIRTPGFGGFQLLDLQDFPGQGTALVGPLNAFMESKGTISSEKWREFCAPVTLLAEFDEYTLASEENFIADIKISNYSNEDKKGTLSWAIKGISEGEFLTEATQGEISEVGQIKVTLPKIKHAQQTTLELKLNGTEIIKSYPLWIYPSKEIIESPIGITVSKNFDAKTIETLENGGRVFLIPNHNDIKDNSVGGLFMTEFWSYRMFYKIAVNRGVEPSPGTLGLLIDNDHPSLKGFPTEFHSNWQWFSAVKNSRPIILDNAPKNYKPIVQTIDNMWRSHKLGTLFEFKVGKGKVLVSAINLSEIEKTIEGNALYQSILDYMNSKDFNPSTEINSEKLKNMLYGK
ncbi:sugar-binding domain-containing protein [Lutibacter citreus]|uniref:sugar-binding domain-containing protein n=1 Tax=Lutibacter citreus TaxID=2138210 RepID=UPI000DBEA146|nr:sugar-binding domain-containing protein [Lutibacter citreus]